MFGFPLVFWHALYASCFDTTLEEFGEKGAQDTESFCNHLVGRILDCVHLGVFALDTLFLVIGSVPVFPGHVESTGEHRWEKRTRTA